MSLTTTLTLFLTMVLLAAVPGVSVLLVSTRAASGGFAQGCHVALGVVVGDIVFILLALMGLVVLIEVLGDGIVWIMLAGGSYLLWLGTRFWHVADPVSQQTAVASGTPSSGFLSGLLITLADQKALLFYFGFFPAFLDLNTLSYTDAGLTVLIAVLAVGGVKLAYAWLAGRVGMSIAAMHVRCVNRLAAVIMFAIAAVLWLRAAAVLLQ